MIPDTEIDPYIADPLPAKTMPDRSDISEEGFGYFRNTWFIGRVLLQEAKDVIRYEGETIEALDESAAGPDEFERLAMAVEDGDWADLPGGLAATHAESDLRKLADWSEDMHPLGGLEIGVAGLSYALSVICCLTAASCRSHVAEYSWSDCPVVFFAAPEWRVGILADLVASADCGMDADRDMLKIFGSSIRKTHDLARLILDERGRFRKRPVVPAQSPRSKPLGDASQMGLLDGTDG